MLDQQLQQFLALEADTLDITKQISGLRNTLDILKNSARMASKEAWAVLAEDLKAFAACCARKEHLAHDELIAGGGSVDLTRPEQNRWRMKFDVHTDRAEILVRYFYHLQRVVSGR